MPELYGEWETADARRQRVPGASNRYRPGSFRRYIEWLGTAPTDEILREARLSGDPVGWLEANLDALGKIRRRIEAEGRQPSRPSPVVVRPSAHHERLHRLLRVG